LGSHTHTEENPTNANAHQSGPTFFISAAEPSADVHGASLIKAVRAKSPDAQFIGVAGPRMVEAGCEAIFDMSRHSAMLLDAIGAAGKAIAMFQACNRQLRSRGFDAAVVIDSPTLHLPLSLRLKAAGIPVLYYIAPQLWAWGKYRVHRLRERADKVACILPFEENFFRDEGVDARFVGHPLTDALAARPIEAEIVGDFRSAGAPFITLLPGSRRAVVERMLPDQLEVARRIAQEFPHAAFGISVANPQVEPIIRAGVARASLNVRIHAGEPGELIQAADLVLVTSGTTTLEVAYYEKPMIVMYRASKLFYHALARWMIYTPHLSLPNILADRRIVPEFMPVYRSPAPIADEAISLLRDAPRREQMCADLSRIVAPLRSHSASEKTAELLLNLAQKHH